MSFCTQCGSQVEETAKFCGKCEAKINREENNQRVDSPVNQHSNSGSPSFNAPPQAKKDHRTWKIGGLVAVALVALIYLMVMPKQLSVQEYEDLAIKLLVADKVAMDEFGETVEYSDVYMGFEPDWTEEYRQFVEPAKKLEQDFVKLRKALEDVKPPSQYQFEHETILKTLNAHENMAASLVTYMETGREEHMEYFEEYESRADDYFEESIFASEQYEDRLYEVYQSSMRE